MKIIQKITIKYKIPSVVLSVQMYLNFSTQKLNNAIALLGTRTVEKEKKEKGEKKKKIERKELNEPKNLIANMIEFRCS